VPLIRQNRLPFGEWCGTAGQILGVEPLTLVPKDGEKLDLEILCLQAREE
jgi:hypothetical protein